MFCKDCNKTLIFEFEKQQGTCYECAVFGGPY